jgi:hypothetical protein
LIAVLGVVSIWAFLVTASFKDFRSLLFASSTIALTSPYTEVDISTWARRTTFEFFRDYTDPYFNITANVDVTKLRRFCRGE